MNSLNGVRRVVERHRRDPGLLLAMLQDLQAEHGYLPAAELAALSRELGLPLARLRKAARAHPSFRLTPPGRHEVAVCLGTVCGLKGAAELGEAIRTEYRIRAGGTTADRLFTFREVDCVGCCALAPVMTVDGRFHGNLTPARALRILRALAREEERKGRGQRPKGSGRGLPR